MKTYWTHCLAKLRDHNEIIAKRSVLHARLAIYYKIKLHITYKNIVIHILPQQKNKQENK